MSLLYCCIACENRILCQHQNGFLRCIDYARNCLQQIGSASQDDEAAYSNENCIVHTLLRDGIVYLAVTERDVSRERTVIFLRQVHTNFSADSALLNRASYSQENELQYDYGRTLAREMESFSRIKTNNKMEKLQGQVDEVRVVMNDNIRSMIERGEKLEDIVDRAEDLHGSASAFNRTARKVKHKMWWENLRMKLILAAVVLVILCVIVIVILWQTGVFSGGGGGGGTVTTPTPPRPPVTTVRTTALLLTTGSSAVE